MSQNARTQAKLEKHVADNYFGVPCSDIRRLQVVELLVNRSQPDGPKILGVIINQSPIFTNSDCKPRRKFSLMRLGKINSRELEILSFDGLGPETFYVTVGDVVRVVPPGNTALTELPPPVLAQVPDSEPLIFGKNPHGVEFSDLDQGAFVRVRLPKGIDDETYVAEGFITTSEVFTNRDRDVVARAKAGESISSKRLAKLNRRAVTVEGKDAIFVVAVCDVMEVVAPSCAAVPAEAN